jgi:hypothetical protein
MLSELLRRYHPCVPLPQASCSNRASTRHRRAANRSFVPQVCALVDRTLTSTFTVLNFLDSGPGSLCQAVLDANAHIGVDTITFAPRVTGTIALTSGPLTVTDPLTIKGPGSDSLRLHLRMVRSC